MLRSQSGPFSSVSLVVFLHQQGDAVRSSGLPRSAAPKTPPSRPCPLATAGVTVLLTALATTVQLALWQAFLEEGGFRSRLQWRECREAGARVRTNVMVRDLVLWPPQRIDIWRLEVVADGLPLHGGAQLAIDTTMVSALATGQPVLEQIGTTGWLSQRRGDGKSARNQNSQARCPGRGGRWAMVR